jgi:hypothetical protein
MKYRAVLRVLVEGKPMQIYGGNLFGVRDWAKATADKYKAAVDVYVSNGELLETLEPELNA